MRYIGHILRNGRVVERSLRVNLRVRGRRFNGEFQLPKNTSIYLGGYELRLQDGRSGKIMINVIDGQTASFDGDGVLK